MTENEISGSRREFVGAVAALSAAGLTGCLGRSEATVEATVVARDDTTEDAIVEAEETIQPGDYFGWELNLDWEHELDFQLEVTEGPQVNAYLVEDSEMENLRDGEEFEALEDGIWGSVRSLDETLELGEGTYWFVAINADRQPVNAPDEEDGEPGEDNTTDDNSTDEET